MSGEGGDGGSPQLRFWDSASRREPLGQLSDDGEEWQVHVVLEVASADLVRGRLAFRREEETLLTAPVIVEETEEAVLRRAEEMPDSMFRQFFASARG